MFLIIEFVAVYGRFNYLFAAFRCSNVIGLYPGVLEITSVTAVVVYYWSVSDLNFKFLSLGEKILLDFIATVSKVVKLFFCNSDLCITDGKIGPALLSCVSNDI